MSVFVAPCAKGGDETPANITRLSGEPSTALIKRPECLEHRLVHLRRGAPARFWIGQFPVERTQQDSRGRCS
jgi:hypothetical protein